MSWLWEGPCAWALQVTWPGAAAAPASLAAGAQQNLPAYIQEHADALLR